MSVDPFDDLMESIEEDFPKNKKPFVSDKTYLRLATEEFTRKYHVDLPYEATRGHPARLKEWCALVYAMKKLHGEHDETWLDGSASDRDRREAVRRSLDAYPNRSETSDES